MATGSVSSKNKEMAKYLKEKGVRRTIAACPIGHKNVALNRLQDHIVTCRG